MTKTYFHMHLLSDSTGETLTTVSRAATAMEGSVHAIEHVYPMVRTAAQVDRAFVEIADAPGIVMYTLVNEELTFRVEEYAKNLGLPCVSVLDPVLNTIQSYLNVHLQRRVGGQHVLNNDYFRRIDALNYTMAHDDGQLPEDLDEADVILLGISRTSKTPTSVYLANRAVRTANVPIVPHIPEPLELLSVRRPLIVGLIASAERIVQIRMNRMAFLDPEAKQSEYVDRRSVADEINHCRRLCASHGWPMIDVTRRSIEETAAEVLALLRTHQTHLRESDDDYTEPVVDTDWEHRR